MGYYANGNGTIYLKSTAPEAALSRIGETMDSDRGKCGKIEAQLLGIPEDSISVSVWDSEKYYEDEITEMLEEVKPYTLCGSIRYTGEDDSIWEFWFDRESGEWKEDGADILWPSDICDRARVLTVELAGGSTLSYAAKAESAEDGLDELMRSLQKVGVNAEGLAVTKAVLSDGKGTVIDEFTGRRK